LIDTLKELSFPFFFVLGQAYDEVARKLLGEDARLNFPEVRGQLIFTDG